VYACNCSKGIVKYLVKWVGYENETWEPVENLEGCSELITAYEAKSKKKVVSSSLT
jgi:hypothetical protein